MNIIDYELIEDISILFNSKIILYGTGIWAEKVFDCLKQSGVYPELVCQTEITKTEFHGYKIELSTNILNNFDSDKYLLIIGSINHYEEIIKLCKQSETIKICTLYGLYTSIRLHIKEDILPKEFEKKIEAGNIIGQYSFFHGIKTYAINQLVDAALAPEDYIWIFQPGKVGSKTIWNSIQDRSIHIHSLTIPYRFVDIDQNYLDYYMQLIHKKRVKIISAVREPISRDIAAFFQNSDLGFWPYNHFNDNILWWYGDIKGLKLNIENMMKRCPQWKGSLNESFEVLCHTIMYYKLDLFSWFDYELNKVFGVNIFNYPFDKNRGYTIIERDNIQILILKMEYLSSLENVISNFIGDENYKLININKASEKIYRYAYKKFKENIKISSDYFDFYYNGNLNYEHFYSKEEIEKNGKYWKNFVN